MSLWHARAAWRSESKATSEAPSAAAVRAPPASSSATSAASRSAASASSRARSSAAGPRSSASATPRSRRPNRSAFPPGRKSGGALTLLVDGAHAPLIQHLTPADHRAGQPLLRLCGDQPHRLPPGQAAGAAGPSRSGRSFAPCPRSSARACAKSPTPSFAPAWSRLPRKLPLPAAPPSLPSDGGAPIPVINRSK